MSRGGSIGPVWGSREDLARLFAFVCSWRPLPRRAAGVSSAGKSHAMKLRAALLIACTGLAMSFAGCLPVLAATRHVVLLFDERVELPGLSLLDAELVNTLRANSTEPVEIYREAMDLSRFSSNSYKALLRDFLHTKYADKKIDVVVAVMRSISC